jgi:hypothetical protein
MQAKPKPTRDTVVASASVQRVPRVSIVLSSYEGGADHFGNSTFTGVPEPRPVSAELTDAQLRALTRRAIELGNHPNQGLRRVLSRDESVALLVNRYADPAVVSAVVEMVKENVAGARITIVSEAVARFSGGTLVDVAKAEATRMPAPGVWSRRDVTYRIPRAILDCDRLISVAPLTLEKGRPSLTIDNFRALDRSDEGIDVSALDLYGFHPPDFAVLGGPFVLRNGSRVRHNLVLAGGVATAVDTIGASILDTKPEAVRHLQIAAERFGKTDLDDIWTLGNEIEDARVPS